MNVNDTAHVDHFHTTNDISLLQKAIVYLKGNSNGC